MHSTIAMSARARAVRPFGALAVSDAAEAMCRAGRDIIRLEIGAPRMPFATGDVTTGDGSDPRTFGYTEAAGLPELRVAIAAWYGQTHDLDLDPTRVVCTAGSSAALVLALMLLTDANDGVAIPDPGYPPYRSVVQGVGARTLDLHLDPASGFRIDAPALDTLRNLGARAAIANTPSNPLGTILSDSEWEALVGSELGLVVDEVYSGMEHDGVVRPTALVQSPEALVVDGFSKKFGLMGLRIGHLVVPSSFSGTAVALHQNAFICAPRLSQQQLLRLLRSGVNLRHPDLPNYQRRARWIADRLTALGLPLICRPEAGLYLTFDVSRAGVDGAAVAHQWLDEIEVALAPGGDFGKGLEHCLRWSLTASDEDHEEALSRIARWLDA